MDCELCGSKNARRTIEIEGSLSKVCDDCVSMGNEIKEVKFVAKKKEIRMPEEMNQVLVSDFSNIIKREREKKRLTQDELAKRLKIKSSLVKRVEEGWRPPLGIIRLLENFFNVILLEDIPEYSSEKKKTSSLTLGDIVEVKNK